MLVKGGPGWTRHMQHSSRSSSSSLAWNNGKLLTRASLLNGVRGLDQCDVIGSLAPRAEQTQQSKPNVTYDNSLRPNTNHVLHMDWKHGYQTRQVSLYPRAQCEWLRQTPEPSGSSQTMPAQPRSLSPSQLVKISFAPNCASKTIEVTMPIPCVRVTLLINWWPRHLRKSLANRLTRDQKSLFTAIRALFYISMLKKYINMIRVSSFRFYQH